MKLKDFLNKNKELNESLMAKIFFPMPTRRVVGSFEKILRKLQEIDLVESFNTKKFLAFINVKIKDIPLKYRISILNFEKDLPSDIKSNRISKGRKYKSNLYGKIKSPYRVFNFSKYGFYDILEDLIDKIEEDVEKHHKDKVEGMATKLNKAREIIDMAKMIDGQNIKFTYNLPNNVNLAGLM